jgi:predicted outer membrane lipoprotein
VVLRAGLRFEEQVMRRIRDVARMAMGGAVWGGLLGLPLGAALGLVPGLWTGHVDWGLDGAVFGLFGFSAAGAGLAAFTELVSTKPRQAADEGRPVPPVW